MVIETIEPRDVERVSRNVLGIGSLSTDLDSEVAIACALRRAAAFLCPCGPATLVRAVMEPLAPWIGTSDLKSTVERSLEALETMGDLIEAPGLSGDEANTKLIYPTPPTFVARDRGPTLILGVGPDGESPLTEELREQVRYTDHKRSIHSTADYDLAEQLRDCGLVNLPLENWLKAPRVEEAEVFLERAEERLSRTGPAGQIVGLSILDFERPVQYYRGRWVDPIDQAGRYIGRRPQAFGADLWCFVELEHGVPSRLIDLPLRQDGARGCDEAWRLQAAIDHERGDPQVLRKRLDESSRWCLDLFSPVPKWAHRRWSVYGEKTLGPGCLFSYRFAEEVLEDEVGFAEEYLWLKLVE